MYDPRQIGAQVWTPDRGNDIPPRGGTVVAVDARTDRLLVITRTHARTRGGRRGVEYTIDTDWVDVADLDGTMTQPAAARMPDRRKMARHLFHVLGDNAGQLTQRDLDILGWARALLEDPPPTKYREPGYGLVDDLTPPDLSMYLEPLEPGGEWTLQLARDAAEANGIDPELVHAGADGGVTVDLGELLRRSTTAHRDRRRPGR